MRAAQLVALPLLCCAAGARTAPVLAGTARWCVLVPPAERAAGRPSPQTVASARRALDRCGFVVLRGEEVGGALVQPPEGLSTCADAALHEVEQLLARVSACGINPRGESFSFAEIVHRARLRYDVQLARRAMAPDAPWPAVAAQAQAWALPLFEAACGEPVECSVEGLITSLRGAPDQAFHRDGPHRAFYAFVPLVDTACGPEFQLGTHLRDGAPDGAPEPAAERVRPPLRAGDVLCYNYRTLHRGVANPAGDRPVFYSGWAAADSAAAGDGFNFGRRALADLERRVQLFPGVPQVPGQGVRR